MAHYLCCLPLRLGVLVISFLQLMASSLATAILVYVLVLDAEDNDESTKIPSRTRIIVIVLAAIYGLVAFISLTGFIGAIRKKESYVALFSGLLKFFFVIQLAAVVVYFVLYFVEKEQHKKAVCIGTAEQNVMNACASKLSLWMMIVSAVVPLLFQAYGVYVVAEYAHKLHNEEPLDFAVQGYPHVHEESHPLTHQPGYPYADKAHSFGLDQV
ncbi:hypothetical protein DFH07DRAFT_769711 [Mycena maculata]|uniref:Uncharacterized protein n=1 Tax=Mycena maculata TaxID=230809 RepID=A0AAD7NN08_9AGAR|nr:hypothetical protein DFH07DRAFT_769711 [Mycena maculata]